MVKPWHEWVFSLYPQPGYTDFDFKPEPQEYEKRIRDFIGNDRIPITVTDVSKWRINEVVAEKYSDGNIFCLGDAVHRHPPPNGLGSNTCVQDAYNLAWKLAYVERGVAGDALLDTYNAERQPIGHRIVERANQALQEQVPIWQALGGLHNDLDERKRQLAEMSAPTKAGRERRQTFMSGINAAERAYGGIGIEMNLQYSSIAVYAKDEVDSRSESPLDPVLYYQISTYPGSRLPHAWLNSRKPVAAPKSTHDLAGNGVFCLFTGPGGDKWKDAAQNVITALGVRIEVYSIGWRQDWEDVYGEWAQRREVDESGCVLIRPDRIVCWRSMMTLEEESGIALIRATKSVLGKL
ncbi:hypothetical protein FH972_022871 [Carpinus fangiana]|uniref:FAD-binding domain-containing protein n=1 Tax=Carpinus fangiana TaxID=176857 RepID=A0A5N6KTH5_9ROSI|nr:hypothetical protein FH972_022871 [Carpinus fangiana]